MFWISTIHGDLLHRTGMRRAMHLFIHRKPISAPWVKWLKIEAHLAQIQHLALFATAPHAAGRTAEAAVAFYGGSYWADAAGWARKLML